MQRLVYAPKVNAWVKSDSGVVDLSAYIVGGGVNRKENQVSSANLSLRNPKDDDGNMIFTEHKRTDGSIGPLLHPMDPIIITLTRLRDKPIQVFTGYLDSSPYLTLYPGTVNLTASCTLKRLQYTYWDPGVDFVQQFLAQYGWYPDPAAGGISARDKELTQLKDVQSFNDSSLGNLLFAVLRDIGGWDESTIYIEPLPKTIGPLVVQLFQQFQQSEKENTQYQDLFEDLLTDMIGSDGYGTGGGTAGNAPGGSVPGGSGHGAGKVSFAQFNEWAQGAYKQYGVLPSWLFAICQIETNFGQNRGPSSAGALGLMQFMPSTARGLGIDPLDDKQAVYGAAKYLRQSGAPGNMYRAIFAYNHADWYVREVQQARNNYIKYDP
jgi:hypothetical protein